MSHPTKAKHFGLVTVNKELVQYCYHHNFGMHQSLRSIAGTPKVELQDDDERDPRQSFEYGRSKWHRGDTLEKNICQERKRHDWMNNGDELFEEPVL